MVNIYFIPTVVLRYLSSNKITTPMLHLTNFCFPTFYWGINLINYIISFFRKFFILQ
jgi:hypothetical protein